MKTSSERSPSHSLNLRDSLFIFSVYFFLPSHVFAFSVSSAFCLFQNLLPKRLRSEREVAVCRRYWKPHGVYSGLLCCQTTLKPMFFFSFSSQSNGYFGFTWTVCLSQSMVMARVISIQIQNNLFFFAVNTRTESPAWTWLQNRLNSKQILNVNRKKTGILSASYVAASWGGTHVEGGNRERLRRIFGPEREEASRGKSETH